MDGGGATGRPRVGGGRREGKEKGIIGVRQSYGVLSSGWHPGGPQRAESGPQGPTPVRT